MSGDLWLAGLGLVAGVVSGCFGIGGGIILVPGFDYFFQKADISPSMIFAVATSLSVVAVVNMMSAWYHAKHTQKKHKFHPYYLVSSIIVGMTFSVLMVPYLPTVLVRALFSVALLWIGWRVLFRDSVNTSQVVIHKLSVIFRGVVIGVCTSILGIGGSLLLMPYLLSIGVSVHAAVGFCTRLTTVIAGLSGLLYMLWGSYQGVSVAYTLGYVYWPALLVAGVPGMLGAWIGGRISSYLPVLWHRRLFAIILLLMACSMLNQCLGE